mmetsp:Transcript_8512/g.14910  ORF Transcript_8512/g.14910 Transcript_8512/m.14910 type:complete len:105 (+) Transcript_8512:264-578(+)
MPLALMDYPSVPLSPSLFDEGRCHILCGQARLYILVDFIPCSHSFIHSFSLSFPPLPLVRRFFVSINNNNNETRCLTRMELERVRATCLPRNSGSMVPSTSPNT